MPDKQPIWFMYDNGIDAGDFVAGVGSWASGAPLSNLKNPNPNKKARTSDLSLTNTKFLFALPSIRQMRGVLLTRTNFHQSGLVRVSGYSDATMVTLVATTGWIEVGSPRSFDLEWENVNYWSGRIPQIDPDGQGLDVPIIFNSPITAKYWLFEFDNRAHENGYFSIGRVFMGTVFQPVVNFAPGGSMRQLTASTIKESTSGMPYGKRRGMYYGLQVNFPHMTSNETLTDLKRMIKIVGTTKQFAIFTDPDAAASEDKLAFLGRLIDLPEFSFENVDRNPTSLQIKGYP